MKKQNDGHKRQLLKNGMVKHTWQNPGMPNQVIFEYLTYVTGTCMYDAVGEKGREYTAYTFDRKWKFVVKEDNEGGTEAVTAKIIIEHYGNSATVEVSQEFTSEYWSVSDTCHEVVSKFNDIIDDGFGYVWCEPVMTVLACISEQLDLGWHFKEWQSDIGEDGWFVANDEIWSQLHYDNEGAYFVFRGDAVDQVCKEVNGTCDKILHKIAIQYPDGELEFDWGYVIIGDPCCCN